MWAIVRRAVVPGVLILAGVASLLYGMMFHTVPVVEEQESKTTIEVPTGFVPGGALGHNAPIGTPPALTKKTVTRIDRVTKIQSEAALTREVTVGGVALLSGEIRRTYRGEGPALCPS